MTSEKNDRQVPVLVGIGQLVNRDRTQPGEPWKYMVQCALKAEEDTGVHDILSSIDNLSMVNVISRNYLNEPLRIATALNANPRDVVTTPIGATAPQSLLNRLCGRISTGESNIGLICGGEAFYTRGIGAESLQGKTHGETRTKFTLFGDLREPVSNLEASYGLFLPAVVYPLFANAYRHYHDLSLNEYILQSGQLCEKYSRTAAQNDVAWFRDSKTAEQISTVTADNRMAHYPFTKYMNAIMNVDQAAALLVMSEMEANRLGISDERRIYLVGCSDASEKWHISNRLNYYSAPGLKIAYDNALAQAELSTPDIDYWDLYNCFPVAAQIALKTFQLPADTNPTITGGLPYFGGAGNNYSLHSICAMVQKLRAEPEKTGVVQSVTWYMSKYAIGIYSGTRPEKFQRRDPSEYMYDIDKLYPDVPVLTNQAGRFEIETYTTTLNREGVPQSAVIIAKDQNGARLFALNDTDPQLIEEMMQKEPIGKTALIRIDPTTGRQVFTDIT